MKTLLQLIKAFSMLAFVFVSLWYGLLWLPLVALLCLACWAIRLSFIK